MYPHTSVCLYTPFSVYLHMYFCMFVYTFLCVSAHVCLYVCIHLFVCFARCRAQVALCLQQSCIRRDAAASCFPMETTMRESGKTWVAFWHTLHAHIYVVCVHMNYFYAYILLSQLTPHYGNLAPTPSLCHRISVTAGAWAWWTTDECMRANGET